ncbi:MAG: N-acetyl-gamma-glutamyl-phosphate reductase [Coriobacteriia bacterium]
MAKAAIIGAAGFTGAELTRLCLSHPGLEPVLVTSDSDAGASVADVYPALAGTDLVFAPHESAASAGADIYFLAVPHTTAMDMAPALLESGARVVDLSADFRLKDATVFERWYGKPHSAPHLLDEAVYGLPELSREGIAEARLVACPGCYPTAALLAAAPALWAGLARPSVVVDAKSGVSGAGRKATSTTHHCMADESIEPYGAGTHRHTPEIAAGLAAAAGVAGDDVTLTFVPHLAPMKRGILATVYLPAEDGVTLTDAFDAYRERYSGEPFITVHRPPRLPATREVWGSNRAHIGFAMDEASRMLIVACAIDNLVKGAAGQAVQCANIMFGMDETAGLGIAGPAV